MSLFADRFWRVNALKDLGVVELARCTDERVAWKRSHRTLNSETKTTSSAASPAAVKRFLRAVLERAGNVHGECFATRETLARDMGLSGSRGSCAYVRRIALTAEAMGLCEVLGQHYTAARRNMILREAPATYIVRVDVLAELERSAPRRWRGERDLRVIEGRAEPATGDEQKAPTAPAIVRAYERHRRRRHRIGAESRDQYIFPSVMSAIQTAIDRVQSSADCPADVARDAVMGAYMAQTGFGDHRLESERHPLCMFAPHADAVGSRAIALLRKSRADQDYEAQTKSAPIAACGCCGQPAHADGEIPSRCWQFYVARAAGVAVAAPS